MFKPKLSQKYIRRVGSKLSWYVGSFLLVAIAVISDAESIPTGIGGFLLIVIAVVVALSPAIVVQLFNVKVKNPKPYFVEPKAFMLAFMGLACVVGGCLGIVLGVSFGWPDIAVGATALAGFTLPINIYMVNIVTRYRRIVEYGTAEWRRFHKKR